MFRCNREDLHITCHSGYKMGQFFIRCKRAFAITVIVISEFDSTLVQSSLLVSKSFQINDVKMYRALSIRSAMAGSLQTETPMFWLNDCIEIIIRLKFDNYLE